MPAVVHRLPWAALLLAVLTAAVLLFGPLWDDARGENPLDRPSGVAWDLLLRLALPTLVVLGVLVVALALPGSLLLAGLAVLFLGATLLLFPAPLSLWFLPALAVTAAAVASAFWDRRPG